MDIPNNVTGTTSTSTASATFLPDDWSVTDVRAIADAAAAAKKPARKAGPRMKK